MQAWPACTVQLTPAQSQLPQVTLDINELKLGSSDEAVPALAGLSLCALPSLEQVTCTTLVLELRDGGSSPVQHQVCPRVFICLFSMILMANQSSREVTPNFRTACRLIPPSL